MKKLITLLLLMIFSTTLIIAQKTADIFIENPTVNGNKFSWEIHITPTNDWGASNRKALGDCSWYFDYNNSALTNPVLTFVAPEVAAADGYTNTTGLTGGKVQATTDLDVANFDGVNLTTGIKHHIYTIEMDIIDPNQQAQISWDQINTGIFNGRDNIITSTYVGSANPPLPVELQSFKATNPKGSSVELEWATATEVNNYGFEIERKVIEENEEDNSELNSTWEKVAFVEGAGNSNSKKVYSYADKNPVGGTKFSYRLKQVDIDGSFEYSDIVTVELANSMEYKLVQNHPNPFNPTTQISFTIPSAGVVKLNIYNILGEVVAELVNKNLEAGLHEYEFNASNLTSGIYFYSISVNGFREVKKMNLIK